MSSCSVDKAAVPPESYVDVYSRIRTNTEVEIYQAQRLEHGRVRRVLPQVVDRIIAYDVSWGALGNLGLHIRDDLL